MPCAAPDTPRGSEFLFCRIPGLDSLAGQLAMAPEGGAAWGAGGIASECLLSEGLLLDDLFGVFEGTEEGPAVRRGAEGDATSAAQPVAAVPPLQHELLDARGAGTRGQKRARSNSGEAAAKTTMGAAAVEARRRTAAAAAGGGSSGEAGAKTTMGAAMEVRRRAAAAAGGSGESAAIVAGGGRRGRHRSCGEVSRTLPAHAARVLRDWFTAPEHVLSPYPTDPERAALAAAAGLSELQVTNWFTNARKRHWQPLLEDVGYRRVPGEAYAASHRSLLVPINPVRRAADAPRRDRAASVAVRRGGAAAAAAAGASAAPRKRLRGSMA